MITLNVFFQVNPAKRPAFLSLLRNPIQKPAALFTSFGNARTMKTAMR